MATQWQRAHAVLLLLLPAGAMAVAPCSVPPLPLAWSNTTVSQDGLAVTRGFEVGIGTPSQIFAFRPATSLNNTRVNNVFSCVSAKNDSCVGGLGGVFDPTQSSTYAVSIKAQWNGSQIDQESATGAYVYFNDFVGFQSNGDVNGFPVVMDSEPSGGAQSSLPLGTNSSFLRASVKGGVAPSTAFGLWSGSRSMAPVDGLLVIGGYDANRVDGDFEEFPIHQWDPQHSCPLQVTITDVAYDGKSLMANSSEKIVACVEPSTQRNVFTQDITFAFANATGQNTSFASGMTYPSNNYPTGNMTITINNNYTTTIPNNELFNLLRGSDQYGRYAITNTSVVEAGVGDNRKNDPNTVVPTLGGLFLTFNYLIVDYDQGIFKLAPAVKSTVSFGSPNLTTLCPPSSPPKSGSSSHTGAIAGGVVGGVVGLAAIAALAFILYRRHKKKREERKPSLAPSELQDTETQPPVAELPSMAEAPAQELPTYKLSFNGARPEAPVRSNGDLGHHDISPSDSGPSHS